MAASVANPYTGGRKRAFCDWHRWFSICSSLILVLLVLSARGYHKRKEERAATTPLLRTSQLPQSWAKAAASSSVVVGDSDDKDDDDDSVSNDKGSDSSDMVKSSNAVDEENDDFTNEEDDDYSSWNNLDSVADKLGGAIEDAGELIHDKVEGVLGEGSTKGLADAADFALDGIGQLTEKVEDWWPDWDNNLDDSEDPLEDGAEQLNEDSEDDNNDNSEDDDSEDDDGSEDSVDKTDEEKEADGSDDVEDTLSDGATKETESAINASNRRLQLTTWNVAAINNNPFEYWLTMPENPAYEEIMGKIEAFIEDPGDLDVKVNTVFTQDMFVQLDKRLTEVGWKSVQEYWENDFSKREIVQSFLKDPMLGSKRLASMPDRITNAIATANGELVFRPTVINMYEKPLDDQGMWWKAWKSFMFDEKIKVKNKNDEIEEKAPYEMLVPISKAKYPAITEEEAKDSLPLQTLCSAIFDAILVHMMNTVSKPDVWQPLKQTIVENLNKKKAPHTLEILEHQYIDSDIIMLQEVSSSLISQAKEGELGRRFHIVLPTNMDIYRDQNSVILLRKSKFSDGTWTEITDTVESMFPEGASVPVARGDILAIKTQSSSGEDYVVASFHGDTNGLATIPVLDAIVAAMKSGKADIAPESKLLFGLDANTYENATPGKTQDVMEWGEHYTEHGLSSCWGDVPQKSNYTTYNARTYLQPQLNKACKTTEKRSKGDVNPKDFILFGKNDYKVVRTWKDNTGEREYKEDMAFPTLHFPSDHGILTTIIEPTSASAVESTK